MGFLVKGTRFSIVQSSDPIKELNLQKEKKKFEEDHSNCVRMQAKLPNVTMEDFELKQILGRGAFGKVYLAELKGQNGKEYAIKVIRKDVLIEFD